MTGILGRFFALHKRKKSQHFAAPTHERRLLQKPPPLHILLRRKKPTIDIGIAATLEAPPHVQGKQQRAIPAALTFHRRLHKPATTRYPSKIPTAAVELDLSRPRLFTALGRASVRCRSTWGLAATRRPNWKRGHKRRNLLTAVSELEFVSDWLVQRHWCPGPESNRHAPFQDGGGF